MPWMSIFTWLLSFLLSKSQGASTAKAAGIATAAGLATYYAIDPANPDRMFDIGFGKKAVPGDPTDDSGATAAPGFFDKAVSEVGSTLRSWGPTGTLGVIAGTTAVGAMDSKTLIWGGLAIVALLVLIK